MVAMQIQLEDQMVTLHVQYAKRKKLSVTVDGSDLITVKAPKERVKRRSSVR